MPDGPENLMITKFHIIDIFKIMIDMFIILIVVIASQVYTYVKMYQVHYKYVPIHIYMCVYVRYIYYLNKAIKKSIPSNNNHQKILGYHESS